MTRTVTPNPEASNDAKDAGTVDLTITLTKKQYQALAEEWVMVYGVDLKDLALNCLLSTLTGVLGDGTSTLRMIRECSSTKSAGRCFPWEHYLEVLEKEQGETPESDYANQITMGLSDEMLQRASAHAEAKGISVQEFTRDLLYARVTADGEGFDTLDELRAHLVAKEERSGIAA